MKNKLKQGYDAARSQLRRERYNRGHLIHWLINVKTWMPYDSLYEIERQQYRWLLNRNKSWNGDILSHFLREYPGRNTPNPNSGRPWKGNRYRPPEQREVDMSDLPF